MVFFSKWTPEQDKIALELLKSNANNAAFLEQVGRSKASAKIRRQRLLVPLPKQEQVHTLSRPTPEMLEDATRRREAPRTLTSLLNGDPEPGRSALDKKNASNHPA